MSLVGVSSPLPYPFLVWRVSSISDLDVPPASQLTASWEVLRVVSGCRVDAPV